MNVKSWAFFCCCALVLLFSSSACAAETTKYTLGELGMTVSIPSDYITFTRDIPEGDPNLTTYGYTKETLSSRMNAGNAYLDAWVEDISQEIIITMIDSPLTDLNLCSDVMLTEINTAIESEYNNLGITITKTANYQHAQAKFIKIYSRQPDENSTVYRLQYYTSYANKAINITMLTLSGEITSSQEITLKNIVDSVQFDTSPQTANSFFTTTSAFTYNDKKTPASFTVPANWVEKPLSQEVEFIPIYVRFSIILYKSIISVL